MNKKLLVILFIFLTFTKYLLSQHALQDDLNILANEFGGVIGLAAKNLKTGEIILINGEKKFPSASIIKVPIMVEFFYQVSECKIDPQSYVDLTDSNKWSGSGILQYLEGSSKIKLIDAVTLMIIVSDNTATNLVIDKLGIALQETLDAVNQRMQILGLKNTRLLNKLMSWKTKTDLPESIRYGVGVTTPEDMMVLLEKMYRGELISPEISLTMIDILKNQQYNSMIPRYLPLDTEKLSVAHKTGEITETRCDVGIVYSPKCDYVVAVFCDESQDHRDSPDNTAILTAARASRIIYNYFIGNTGFDVPKQSNSINWNFFPGGKWVKLKLKNALFPHSERMNGYKNSNGEYFSYKDHYNDSSAVIVIPKSWHETENGVNLIVHFHGHNNNVLNVLEKYKFPQQLVGSKKNAILILAQGPKNAPDSFGGKMEEPEVFKNFIEEILDKLKQDEIIGASKINKIIISAHSGGYRPAAFVLDKGGITNHISEVYLFDAFYGEHDKFFSWIKNYHGKLISIYTAHLAEEHNQFFLQLENDNISYSTDLLQNRRLTFYLTDVCHDCVMEGNFERYLRLSNLDEVN